MVVCFGYFLGSFWGVVISTKLKVDIFKNGSFPLLPWLPTSPSKLCYVRSHMPNDKIWQDFPVSKARRWLMNGYDITPFLFHQSLVEDWYLPTIYIPELRDFKCTFHSSKGCDAISVINCCACHLPLSLPSSFLCYWFGKWGRGLETSAIISGTCGWHSMYERLIKKRKKDLPIGVTASKSSDFLQFLRSSSFLLARIPHERARERIRRWPNRSKTFSLLLASTLPLSFLSSCWKEMRTD